MLLKQVLPRNLPEEQLQYQLLPAPVHTYKPEATHVPEKSIRIINNPRMNFENLEDSCELSSQLQTTLNVGEHPFAQMEDDIDRQRLLGNQPSYTRIDPEIAYMTSDLQKRERYERLLRRAKTEDLAEVSGIGCLYQCGVDKLGRPVIVFIGKWFKFNEINLDKALLYLIYLLDPLVEKDYVIIYFHTITTSDNHPSMTWIRQVYDVLQYKHKKNLKSFYIIHPTFWTKIMTWWFTTFMAPQIKHKVHTFSGVEYLYDIIDPDQLEIPAYIIEHDMTINGIRYHRPSSS
ncbi:UNVERIFIED_CONTAM: hypothetical protein RMT77_015794 [Armadillidium vulgare]